MAKFSWEITRLIADAEGVNVTRIECLYSGTDGDISSSVASAVDVEPTPLDGLTEAAAVDLVASALADKLPFFAADIVRNIEGQKSPVSLEVAIPWEAGEK